MRARAQKTESGESQACLLGSEEKLRKHWGQQWSTPEQLRKRRTVTVIDIDEWWVGVYSMGSGGHVGRDHSPVALILSIQRACHRYASTHAHGEHNEAIAWTPYRGEGDRQWVWDTSCREWETRETENRMELGTCHNTYEGKGVETCEVQMHATLPSKRHWVAQSATQTLYSYIQTTMDTYLCIDRNVGGVEIFAPSRGVGDAEIHNPLTSAFNFPTLPTLVPSHTIQEHVHNPASRQDACVRASTGQDARVRGARWLLLSFLISVLCCGERVDLKTEWVLRQIR